MKSSYQLYLENELEKEKYRLSAEERTRRVQEQLREDRLRHEEEMRRRRIESELREIEYQRELKESRLNRELAEIKSSRIMDSPVSKSSSTNVSPMKMSYGSFGSPSKGAEENSRYLKYSSIVNTPSKY
eukprot:CAMPEP_0114592380 /NCGR_PEP_ID=MMETSP0125-20121206/14221_1 /TAXON_ID=485358 ORGANISM="Aristerostoma sp., Strain ATCC 50986" /NCGR_SAMPLE_ID=MMETSP0125 /ASSEMBLY_ACC=CAM_ASM_000245 /LENGTH=128 /DNA_ID=CAMNT_0001790995 /DNA_START=61 /DNA_END=447 /DNA_ORIENTATION=-